jgi:hypothetical protein
MATRTAWGSLLWFLGVSKKTQILSLIKLSVLPVMVVGTSMAIGLAVAMGSDVGSSIGMGVIYHLEERALDMRAG